MNEKNPKVIVVTPVKNEDWILERFLSVTSKFADLIIIADQNSTDSSREICQKYSKVHLIENKSEQYDESSRQILLIETARKLVPEHKIILALDADEILAADAIQTQGWQTMLKAKPGTILCFEKPDLYLTPDQCIRYDICWPLGYVDDGAEHNPKKVHSIRIPTPDYAQRLEIHDVKILHYAITRLNAQSSKWRMYSVIENTLGTKSLLTRRRTYCNTKDWKKGGRLENSPDQWFQAWESEGIDMKSITNRKYHWQDIEVLKYFSQYGLYRYWFDDIWDFDWEKCRKYAKTIDKNTYDFPITPPPFVLTFFLKCLDWIYLKLSEIKNFKISF